MAGYSLLTTLTLNAAGYNKGIDQAKTKTKEYAKGVDDANKAVKSSFSSLAGLFGGITSQVDGIRDAALGGIKAFKGMLPAIKGVWSAIVATGIGIVVVALGAAFAALSSYLTGTKDGADKLNKILGYAKGIFTAILQRVKLLGEAIALVFEGKFGEAGKKLKEAFAGGLLEEIKATANAAIGFADRENALREKKIQLIRTEAELSGKISEAKLIVEDKSKSINERQNALNQAVKLTQQLENAKLEIAKEEYEILVGKNKLSGESYENSEKEATAYAAMLNVSKQKNDALKEMVAKQTELTNQVKAEFDAKKKTNELERIAPKSISTGVGVVPTVNPTKLQGLDNRVNENLKETIRLTQLLTAEQFKNSGAWNQMREISSNFAEGLTEKVKAVMLTIQLAGQGIAMLSNVFEAQKNRELARAGNDAKKKEEIERKYRKKQQAMALANAVLNGAAAVTMALATIPPPASYVFAGISAAMAATEIAVIATQKFASGGIVQGQSYYGDKITAGLNSGEMVLNAAQQANLFRMANNGGGAGAGEVTFRIDGTQLVGVLSNHNRRINRIS